MLESQNKLGPCVYGLIKHYARVRMLGSHNALGIIELNTCSPAPQFYSLCTLCVYVLCVRCLPV